MLLHVPEPSAAASSADQGISRPELLSALSFALDLTEGAREGHSVRACLLGMRLVEEIGLTPAQRSGLLYGLLLKNVGCSSNAARLHQIFGSDERAVKQRFELVDWWQPSVSFQMLRFVWGSIRPPKPCSHASQHLFELGKRPGNSTQELIQLRCDRGASILSRLGMEGIAVDAVHFLDEHWDGSGYPAGLRTKDIPIGARIAAVASTWTSSPPRPARTPPCAPSNSGVAAGSTPSSSSPPPRSIAALRSGRALPPTPLRPHPLARPQPRRPRGHRHLAASRRHHLRRLLRGHRREKPLYLPPLRRRRRYRRAHCYHPRPPRRAAPNLRRAALLHDIGKLGAPTPFSTSPDASPPKSCWRSSSTPFTAPALSSASPPSPRSRGSLTSTTNVSTAAATPITSPPPALARVTPHRCRRRLYRAQSNAPIAPPCPPKRCSPSCAATPRTSSTQPASKPSNAPSTKLPYLAQPAEIPVSLLLCATPQHPALQSAEHA